MNQKDLPVHARDHDRFCRLARELARPSSIWQAGCMSDAEAIAKTITIKIAAQRLGVSTKTVRRWQGKIIDQPRHTLRKHFDPLPKQEREFKEKNHPFTWKFSDVAFQGLRQTVKKIRFFRQSGT